MESFTPCPNVDMRIGLDIASLTLKKLSSLIVLVTGDSDFALLTN
jgi:uncharacterized LabA/DUF88 family protein